VGKVKLYQRRKKNEKLLKGFLKISVRRRRSSNTEGESTENNGSSALGKAKKDHGKGLSRVKKTSASVGAERAESRPKTQWGNDGENMGSQSSCKKHGIA